MRQFHYLNNLFRSFTLFLVLPLYLMATMGLLSSNLLLIHRAAFQSYARIAELPDLTVFNFSEEEFNGLDWTVKGREFRWREMMFDVSTIEQDGKGYRVTCKHDVVESFVAKTLSFLKKDSSKPVKKRSRKDFQTKHFAQKVLRALPLGSQIQKNALEHPCKPSLVFMEVKSPPPEVPCSA